MEKKVNNSGYVKPGISEKAGYGIARPAAILSHRFWEHFLHRI